jgi:hypothetical protein
MNIGFIGCGKLGLGLSLLCEKPGWIYNIDERGNIINKEKHKVPNNIEIYKSENVVKQIINEFKSII